MGCAMGLVKIIMFVFNLIFALAGLAFLIIGVLFKLNLDDYTGAIKEHNDNFAVAPTLLIVLGSIVFIIAFFGCCGAIKENTCMLTTYAVILLIIFILQVAIGVFAFLQVKDADIDLNNSITKALQESFDKYGGDDESINESVNLTQKGLECCGVNGPDFWKDKWNNGTAPNSCCTKNEENTNETCPLDKAFKQGCAKRLLDLIDTSITTIGYVACTIAAIELIGAIFALCLSSSIRNEGRRGGYA